jgi:hypothetical protein
VSCGSSLRLDAGDSAPCLRFHRFLLCSLMPSIGCLCRAEPVVTASRYQAPPIGAGVMAMVVEQAREDPKDKKELSSVLYQMDGFAAQCVERYLELSNQKESSLEEVPTPTLDESAFSTADWEARGELAGVCAKIVMKVLFTA